MVDNEEESRAKYILDIARRDLDAHNAANDSSRDAMAQE